MLFEAEPEEERECDGKGDETRHLCGFEQSKDEFVVVAAQVFKEEACGGVEHDVEGERLSLRMIRRAKDEEKREDEDVKLTFPDFRWPQGLVAIREERESAFRIEYSKGRACRSTESVPVHEIGATTNSLPKNNSRGDDIGKRPGVDFVMICIDDSDGSTEKYAALYGHAALPYVEDFRKVVLVVVPVKEKDIP